MTKIKKIENKKEENKRILSYKQMSILWIICGCCWFVSVVLNIIAKEKFIFDLIIGILFIAIGIVYMIKWKKNN